MPAESVLLRQIRLALADEPDLVLWRLSQGGVRYGARTVQHGLVRGAADLIGILSVTTILSAESRPGPRDPRGRYHLGRFLALEIKAGMGRVSREQHLFLSLVRRHGGFGAVVRSLDEARAAIQRARRGASE